MEKCFVETKRRKFLHLKRRWPSNRNPKQKGNQIKVIPMVLNFLAYLSPFGKGDQPFILTKTQNKFHHWNCFTC